MSKMKDHHDEWTRDGEHNHPGNKEEEVASEPKENDDQLMFRIVFHKDNETGDSESSTQQQETLH